MPEPIPVSWEFCVSFTAFCAFMLVVSTGYQLTQWLKRRARETRL